MEDVLVLAELDDDGMTEAVLILVVVEDVLVQQRVHTEGTAAELS